MPNNSNRPKTLFYPSSGKDIYGPVKLFRNEIQSFWFADYTYAGFHTNHRPISTADALKSLSHEYEIIDSAVLDISGTTIRRKLPYKVQIHKFTLRSRQDNLRIEVNLCAGHGFNVFRSIYDDLGLSLDVFFYRNDSTGEGGSGFYWLESRLTSILTRMPNGGRIYSDGTNASEAFAPVGTEDNRESFTFKNYKLTPIADDRNRLKHWNRITRGWTASLIEVKPKTPSDAHQLSFDPPEESRIESSEKDDSSHHPKKSSDEEISHSNQIHLK